MKKVALFVNHDNPMDYFTAHPEYWDGYSQLYSAILAQGGECFLVNKQESYLGEGRFTQAWIFGKTQLVPAGEQQVDVVLDKGRFISDGKVPVLNVEKVKKICTDKWFMYQQFSKYCPTTFYLHNSQGLETHINDILSEKVVFKPVDGQEGYGVFIESKAELLEKKNTLSYPALLQEFLDTSTGIPNIIDGIHDLRVAILNGEIVCVFVRTPAPGSLLANVAQGGSLKAVSIDQLPKEVVDIVREVDKYLADCPYRYYGIDLGYTPQGPKIIEMNCELALFSNDRSPIFTVTKEKLATTLLQMA